MARERVLQKQQKLDQFTKRIKQNLKKQLEQKRLHQDKEVFIPFFVPSKNN
jgi:hypothetical protein